MVLACSLDTGKKRRWRFITANLRVQHMMMMIISAAVKVHREWQEVYECVSGEWGGGLDGRVNPILKCQDITELFVAHNGRITTSVNTEQL